MNDKELRLECLRLAERNIDGRPYTMQGRDLVILANYYYDFIIGNYATKLHATVGNNVQHHD